MLKKSLAKTDNLLRSANNFPKGMITGFAEAAPEAVHSMYMELYDESKDLCERIANFKNKSNTLLERYGNGAAQHYQYENAIMTYLWLRYPDKYYIYKFGEVKLSHWNLKVTIVLKRGLMKIISEISWHYMMRYVQNYSRTMSLEICLILRSHQLAILTLNYGHLQ